MSSRAGWSSACRTGHHDRCSGYRKTGKKRKKCTCPCHGTPAKALEQQLKAQGMISEAAKVVVKRSPRGEITQELPPNSSGPGTNSPILPSQQLMSLMARAASMPEQPVVRPVCLQIVPEKELPTDTNRPACFGNCADISSTCDNCPDYNACRRATR